MSASSKKRDQLTLEFADNRILAALGGAQLRNFVQIEKQLDVHIDMRGNLVAIEGAALPREQAAAALRSLYARAEAGESVAQAEVDAEIRFVTANSDGPAVRDFGQPAIKTATTRVTRARSPAQAA